MNNEMTVSEKEIQNSAGFVHLHVHTEYSLLDGMCKIKDLVKKIKEIGMPACAITDHGSGYGLVEFYNECKENGIKPILGCECYEAPNSRYDKNGSTSDDHYYHLVLLVKNETGYKNLCRLISRSNTEGFYYKPRIDKELLEQFHEGLICLSGCIAGRIARMIRMGRMQQAEEDIIYYKALFGDDFYLEIQNHGIRDEQLVANELVRFSRKHGIKLVCTNDSHYVNSNDALAHEWLLCLQTGKTITDENRLKYEGDYSIKTEKEMRALFPSLPDAFDNTMEIAAKCNFDFVYGEYRMPKVVIPEEYGTDYYRYLEDEAWKGFEQRYPESYEKREEARSGLTYELSVVKDMGFAEYFIDTRKTILWARENNILVGPGRGSAAGSKLCYCVGITDIDPIPYNLLFERFLNPERISMPDIDVDYDYSHKEDIVAEEARSNGLSNFAKIQTFVTMQAKGVVRDVARIAGYPASVGAKLSSFIPNELKMTLDKAWELNPEIEIYLQTDPGLKQVWDVAKKLEGLRKSSSTHACGHIPTPVPCEELFPVSVDSQTGYLVCQYNMVDAEHLGNLKKDLLMLRNLTVIDIAHKAIKERYGIEIPLWTEEILNDKKALQMISAGDTNGVFQLESEGMKNFMRDLKPSCFEDIIAGVALYRPGPMDFIPDYIKGKKDPSSIQYLTPELESILAPTYGVIVYQEQVMQIVQKLAGFSMGRADVVRKAMGKKQQALMDKEAPHFIYGDKELGIDGCINRGILREVSESIWDQMVDFAKYAFNKSHAAAYAAVSMQTAYLKANYPLEFASGLLTSVMDDSKKLAIYSTEYKKKGFRILSPDVNSSGLTYTVIGNEICYGLSSIKNVGKEVVNILREREENGPYLTFADFIRRNTKCNKKAVESLIKAGAMDFSGLTRKAMIEASESLVNDFKKEEKIQCKGQMNLFDLFETDSKEHAEYLAGFVENVPEYDMKEILAMEKEATGSYITQHPMDTYASYLEKNHIANSLVLGYEEEDMAEEDTFGYQVMKDANGLEDKSPIRIAGLITDIKVIFTKKDNKQMAFLTLEDQYSSFDIVVFPKIFEIYRHHFAENMCIIVDGKVSLNDDKAPSVLAEQIYFLDNMPTDLFIRVYSYQDYLSKKHSLVKLKNMFPGTVSSILIYDSSTKKYLVEKNCIYVDEKCTFKASELFGSNHVATRMKTFF